MACRGCGICVVGKMAKDVGTAIRKSSYCGVVSTLFDCFFGIPSLHSFSFFKCFFVTFIRPEPNIPAYM